jgi:hypothetical protein
MPSPAIRRKELHAVDNDLLHWASIGISSLVGVSCFFIRHWLAGVEGRLDELEDWKQRTGETVAVLKDRCGVE